MEKSPPKIWYISHYVTPPEYDTHSRAIKLSKYLKDAGYNITIFTSSFLHNKKINLITDNRSYFQKDYDGLNFVHIKTRGYEKNGIGRILSMIEFSFRIFFLKKKFPKPDLIIHTAYVPFENLVYLVAKKLKAKYIIEILDLWPESFVAYGIISRKNPFLRFAYTAEKWLYEKADKIIFSMKGGLDYVIEKKWDTGNGGPVNAEKIYHINNGVDLREFEFNKNNYKINDPDLESDSVFRVIYIGSIRLANDLALLIKAATSLKEYDNIKFLIYGDGNERSSLEKYCSEHEIKNVLFKQKWIELKYVPYVLSKSSLNIINYMPSDILRYGGSQGKLFQYLASGKPICSNQKMGHCIIEDNKLGISRTFTSADEYSDAILSFYNMERREYARICERVRKVALDYDYSILSEKLKEIIKSTLPAGI